MSDQPEQDTGYVWFLWCLVLLVAATGNFELAAWLAFCFWISTS